MDLTRLSVRDGSLRLWNYCYSCRLPGLVDGRMKFHLVIFLAAALPRRISGSEECVQDLNACSEDYYKQLVCAILDGCFLEMEWCATVEHKCARFLAMEWCEVVQHNCSRFIQPRLKFSIHNYGKCKDGMHPMCSEV